jgi:outer membrane protein OmpA-like peptidoglycan-associated protein
VKDKNVYDEKASEDGVDVQFGVEAFVGEELLSADDEKLAVLAPYNYRIDSTGQEFKYVVGAWREVAEAYETWTELIEKGFADAVVAPLDPTLNVASPGVLQFILHSLQFDSNTWSIRASSFEDLDKLVEHLHTNPEDNIRIDAYTDAYGSAERNLILSKNRAKSVKDYLITKGIVDARITAVGIGAENPIASNETAEGRQQNRRVEIMLSK